MAGSHRGICACEQFTASLASQALVLDTLLSWIQIG